ncbi:hypothetical protein DI09_29p100 [Mitosporidium daphniae]|uniref:Uncharacterized protein n=1 Tax=Mitosporidium daphniae TaxID=1485682 RepID=A0A098VS88_9MICR|nr:uncharacterized protein DI09_29p100 [Mitosporidium daphniae]KGG51689.1 hypothetical protein DI09_29p100 [Mitosporidium daphniae]|eukprot:XP_013238116.1 uncharacterized protein DI09_29p100 [Mitosporidium daphniae]
MAIKKFTSHNFYGLFYLSPFFLSNPEAGKCTETSRSLSDKADWPHKLVAQLVKPSGVESTEAVEQAAKIAQLGTKCYDDAYEEARLKFEDKLIALRGEDVILRHKFEKVGRKCQIFWLRNQADEAHAACKEAQVKAKRLKARIYRAKAAETEEPLLATHGSGQADTDDH